jgi:diketogulonate reductase-like aldo/keto reductase
MSYYEKYLKYKNKYLLLKQQHGGQLDSMPQLCFGTAQQNIQTTLNIALSNGICHIDGAESYGIDDYKKIIKETIKQIPREQLWITWKADNINIEKITEIIAKLECRYIDTFLVHHDYDCTSETDFIELQQAHKMGIIRYFGVSNCEKIERLRYLKEKYNISTIQIQARPPGGKINGKIITPPDFIKQCNDLGINVMLYGTVSGALMSDNIELIYEDISHINKYYIQKYCMGTNNVLIMASVSGNTIIRNKNDFDKIMQGEKILSDFEMWAMETVLKDMNLNRQ